MDLQDWELLSVDGLVDFHDDGDEGKAFSRKRTSYADSFVDADYFRCPSPKSWKFLHPTGGDSWIRKQILPVAVQLEARTEKEPDPDEESLKEVIRMEKEPDPDEESLKVVAKMVLDECKVQEMVVVPPPEMVEAMEEGQRPSQVVFLKKTTENEFADMKLDSPKFSAAGVKGFVPTIDAFFFDEPSEVKKKKDSGSSWEDDEVKGGGANIWKWGLTGVGALCSFGVAAATVCVLILGNRNCTVKQNRNFTFQIYTDDKRIKQVVEHASKLNEAISAVRGVPMTGAHITFGGYYDGL